MAIAIYPPHCDDFSTNGLGILTPLECTIEEQAGGMYEMKLVHPIDNTLRWAQISIGCILRAPAPVRESPLYAYVEDVYDHAPQQVTRRIYRTNTQRMYLRKEPKVNTRKLCAIPVGTQLALLSYDGVKWAKCMKLKGGQVGYCPFGGLTYVRSQTETVQGGQVIGQRSVEYTQSREQLFRITAVETDTEAGTVTATAQHVFYDLRGNLINGEYEPKKVEAAKVIDQINAKLLNENEFTIQALNLQGKITADYGFKSPVEALLDPDEGIAAQTGALVVRDNYEVYLLPDKVRDSGVTVRRGKNLAGVTATTDMSDVVTRIIPEGKTKDGKPLYLSGTRYVDSPHINDYPTILAQRIEYDVKIVEKDADNETTFTNANAARAKLKALAAEDFSENGVDLPSYGMEVDFVMLQEPEDFASLQSVYLYDTVTVIDELIGLKAKVRVTGYTWNALTQQYEKVTLGELQDVQQTVYSYNLPNRGISGTKIANNTLDGFAIRDATIEYAKIAIAAIEQLTANAIVALSARIREIVADQIVTDELYAALAELNRVVIEKADIDWAQIQSLQAAVAKLAQASIGTADIDWAQIKDMITGTAIITKGEAGKLFISQLAVTEANMVSLTTGELIVKGADGRFYAITVDEEGNIQAQLKQIGNDDVVDESINAGEKIIEGTVTAACLNATEIFADSAIIRELIAANLDVDTLFAREAFINLLRTSKIVGDKTLELVVQDAAEAKEAVDGLQDSIDANSDRMDELEESAVTRPEFERYVRLKVDGLHVGDNRSNSEAVLDSYGLAVVVNGQKYSRFASTYAQFGNYQLGLHPSEGGLVIRPA